MKIILTEYVDKFKFNAGSKARSDAVKILTSYGYKHIPLYRSQNNKIIILFQILYGCMKSIISLRKGDSVFIQYPYTQNIVNKFIINLLWLGKKLKKFNIILLIHDVNGIRTRNNQLLLTEIKLFNKCDNVICHNDVMYDELFNNGVKTKLIRLNIFDYLYDKEPLKLSFSKKKEIIIAGNLSKEKSGFIYKLDKIDKCQFNLFGVGFNEFDSRNIKYFGAFPPDELIEHLKGNFGLVWDGNVLEECDGNFGNYLKYNNPHKLSLYLAAGLPVIVWKKSALSKFVLKNKIGISVNSLLELNTVLYNIKEQDYNELRNNVLKVRKNIINGEFLLHAIYEIEGKNDE